VENPWSVRKCPDCAGSRTPETNGQLGTVTLIISVLGIGRAATNSALENHLSALAAAIGAHSEECFCMQQIFECYGKSARRAESVCWRLLAILCAFLSVSLSL